MNRTVKFFRMSLLICLISLLITIPVLAMPSMPSSFYGTVKVNGSNVPDGTLVEALIGGQVYAKGYIQTYQSDSIYALDISGDDTDTTTQEGGREGETIQFKVGGVLANETGIWNSATNVNLNLNLTDVVGGMAEPQTAPSPVPTQTAITITQPSPVPSQSSAAGPVPTQTNAPLTQAAPIPTQTPIGQIQPSSIPATSVQSTKMAALPNDPSEIPTTIIDPAVPPTDSATNSNNGGTIIAVVTITSVAAGGVLLTMKRKINIAGKSK